MEDSASAQFRPEEEVDALSEVARPVRRPRAPEGVAVRPDVCLYYPHFEVRDENWAKEALLYWETIATIVPLDVDTASFSSQLYRDLADAGAVEPWGVSRDARERATDVILQLLDAGYADAFPEGEPFTLNFGKLTRSLIAGLKERGVDARATGQDVLVDFRVGSLVMCVLAHVLADAMKTRPLTDHPQLGETYLNVMGASPRGSNTVTIIAQDIALAIPDLRDVDLRAWLAFRDKHRRELTEYRESVTSLAREAAGAEDEDEALSVFEARRATIERYLESKKGFFKRLTASTTLSAVSLLLGLPSLVDPGVIEVVTGTASPAIGVKQLMKREVHQLSFVQKLSQKWG